MNLILFGKKVVAQILGRLTAERKVTSDVTNPPAPAGALADDSPRASAVIQKDLTLTAGRVEVLKARVLTAQLEQSQAQCRYDSAVQDFALSGANEPDGSELRASVVKSGALRRVAEFQERKLTNLRREHSDALLAEALAEGKEKLLVLPAAAQAKLDVFSRALSEAFFAERDLFTILFDTTSGLRQPFDGDLLRDATRLRAALRVQVLDLAEKFGWQLNDRFATDGEVNLGASGDYKTVRVRSIKW